MLQTVKIKGVEYQADEEILKVISRAATAYNGLKDAAIAVRTLQKEYFKTKDTRILAKVVELEAAFDKLLSAKPNQTTVEQKQLFT